MRVTDLETPALVIDLDIMERNLCRAAEYARSHGLRLRPHTKTHKIPALGRRQLELGAAGLTVAKVGEAEVMIETGTPDLLVAYPVLGHGKLGRLMQIARLTRVTVALDSEIAARQLSQAASVAGLSIRVLAEVDAGLGRMGVAPGEELIELVRAITRLPGLVYEGIQFYPGHVKELNEQGLSAIDSVAALLKRILDDLRRAGLVPRIVSGGSTPSLFHSHRIAGMNEIRPGTYIFNDRNTVLAGACTLEDCAASIVTTVVSTAKPGQMIIDGGSKTFSSDRPTAGSEISFGYVVEAPGAVFFKMNEEHGFVDLRGSDRRFTVGDRVHIVPNHICTAMNLHETVYGIRGGEVAERWRVEARGKLQ
jgi:D-serine deaminase-like pyridoxal phosphate-dependent protein